MIKQTIFDIDQPLDKKKSVVTFDLPPSQQLFNIRSILSARKRKSSSSSSTPSSSSTSSVASSPSLTPSSLPSHLNNKKQKLVFDDMISGLPSPPVESPKAEFPTLSNDSVSDDTPPLTPNISSSVTANSSSEHDDLSADDIKAKIAALREEKHNLFQLMKRLVEQEEQQQQQQKKLKQQQQLEQQQQQQQQQQQDLKKKKVSRWSSSTPISTGSFQKQQRHSLSPAPRAPFSNKPLNSRSSSFHFHPTATARPNGYFGQRTFSHRQPYLY